MPHRIRHITSKLIGYTERSAGAGRAMPQALMACVLAALCVLALPSSAWAGRFTALVTPEAGSTGFGGASADGTRVFFSTSESLVGADTDGGYIDVYERSRGATTLVSAPGAGASGAPEYASFAGASADGTRVFFSTYERLVAADTDDLRDVYVSTVDAMPPDTTITKGPARRTLDRTPTFKFTSTEPGSSFECKLDGESFAPCTSPKTYDRRLGFGEHRFRVRATDPAMNVDPTPAVWTFEVVRG